MIVNTEMERLKRQNRRLKIVVATILLVAMVAASSFVVRSVRRVREERVRLEQAERAIEQQRSPEPKGNGQPLSLYLRAAEPADEPLSLGRKRMRLRGLFVSMSGEA